MQNEYYTVPAPPPSPPRPPPSTPRLLPSSLLHLLMHLFLILLLLLLLLRPPPLPFTLASSLPILSAFFPRFTNFCLIVFSHNEAPLRVTITWDNVV